jgi:N-acetylglucosaminylphosphatidylinositol deacetylase
MALTIYFLGAVGAFVVFHFLSIYLSLTLFSSQCNKLSKSLGEGPYLLVIAHPDDECMFFAPTLLSLGNENVYVLSISSGNFDGLGFQRKSELLKSFLCFGISHDRITVMDDKRLQDDPNIFWETEFLAKRLSTHLAMIRPKVACFAQVITFDSKGVSGHLNHISTFSAIQ